MSEDQEFSENRPEEHLEMIAAQVVLRVQGGLPEALRLLAAQVPVVFQAYAGEDLVAEGYEPDILGLFVGEPLGQEASHPNPLPGHIVLFLESIADYAEDEGARFREEVRITYLHELGHYLGWDEEQVSARGLE
jgi:predicted Zn-dependent protease with MMP-like domain